jgi:hypothetical protein
VIVHVGFAISQLDEEEALKTLEMLRMLDPEGMDMELGSMARRRHRRRGRPAAVLGRRRSAAGAA